MRIETGDAYGREIYDHLQNGGGVEIVERDDGYIDANRGPDAYFAPFEQWPAHQQQAMGFAKGRVLDIGCGAGRHSLYLQGKGLDVTGVDISPLAIETCRLRGLKNAVVRSITQIRSDLGVFDTILMLGNNFGLFGNADLAKRLLRRFHRLTSADARIIAESNDIHDTTNPEHLAFHRRNLARGRMAGQVRIRVRYRNCATPWFDYLMVSQDEMKVILDGTGWAIERVLKSDSSSYIAVIAKCGEGAKA